MFNITVGQRLAIAGFLIKFSAKVLSLIMISELINWEKIKTQKDENYFSILCLILLGRTTGIEPANAGTTTQCLNHLATLAYKIRYTTDYNT